MKAAMTMTGKGFDVDSDFLVKKCARRSCDRISELPDEIITHIVSFLPLKEAVATSILSPRWSNSWKYVPNLAFVSNFDHMITNIPKATTDVKVIMDRFIEHSLKNAECVNSVLNSYKALFLKQFTIAFYVHSKAFDHVSKWLRFAFSRRVESLKLLSIASGGSVFDINIFRGIQSSDYRFLRELTLNCSRVSGEAIAFLLRNCTVLEGLIMKATLTSDVVIIGGTLKYLEIDSLSSPKIKVIAPNLTRLLIFHCNLENLLLENVPNLVEASFLIDECETMLHFSEAAAKLEILTISLTCPWSFPVPQMPQLKKLVVDYASVNEEYMLPITCLLEASPCLEEFKLEISDTDYFSDPSIRKANFEVPEDGGFRHEHLQVFEFVGFCDEAADHVALVRYIGNNCVGLEEIVILTPVARELQRQVLKMKKSTEKVLAGKLSNRIKLLVN